MSAAPPSEFARNTAHRESRGLRVWFSAAKPGASTFMRDLSGNRRHADTTSSGWPRRSSSQLGPALDFDPTSSGNDIRFAEGEDLLGLTTPFTITWVSMQDAVTDTFPCICSLRTASGARFELIYSSNGTYSDLTFGGSANWNNSRVNGLTGVAVAGVWHFGVMTYNGAGAGTQSNFTIWINGIEQTLSSSGGLGAPDNVNVIGSLTNRTDSDFDGKLVDWRLYGREWDARDAKVFYEPGTRWGLLRDLMPRSYAVIVAPPAGGVEIFRRRIEG